MFPIPIVGFQGGDDTLFGPGMHFCSSAGIIVMIIAVIATM